VIRFVLGGYAHNLPFSAFELSARSSIPNDLAGLVSKRFVTAVETNESVRLNEARVKALTGGDPITARFLYGEFFSFDPTAKFWLAFNHKPQVGDTSHGFWRRIHLIPFNARFSGTACDKNLLAKLKAEASGILAWAVQGCLLWQREGLRAPSSVEAATKVYREESDPLAEFLQEHFVESTKGFVESKVFRRSYEDWAKANGEKPLNNHALSNLMRSRGFHPDRQGHERTRGWRGLRLMIEEPTILGSEDADMRTAADAKLQ
jgi:putative DNA primase/helicase